MPAKTSKDTLITDGGFPKSVETRQPEKIEAASVRASRFRAILERMTIGDMRDMLVFCKSNTEKYMIKNQMINALVDQYVFTSREHFDAWITLFPPVSQEILRDASVYGYTLPEKYESKNDGKPIVPKKKNQYYYSSWDLKFDTNLKLDFIRLIRTLNHCVIIIPSFLRPLICPWFTPPPEADIENCAMEETSVPQNNRYSNSDIAGAFPLLCEALPDLLEGMPEEWENIKRDIFVSLRPFGKKQLAALRTKSGFADSPVIIDKGPDTLDLAARFILSMSEMKPQRPEDGPDGIKKIVESFFDMGVPGKRDPKKYEIYRWDYIEMQILTPHLKKKGISPGFFSGPPPARKLFQNLLLAMGAEDCWFSLSSLALHIVFTGEDFYIVQPDVEDRLYIRAAALDIDGIVFADSYGDSDFWPFYAFKHKLLIRPLLGAYCCLFAALGLMEIAWKAPEEPVTTNQDKTRPISSFDGITAVRMTPLGRWCMGITAERPDFAQEQYEAIADRELLLVTVRGFSFERTLYLDDIGEKLGDDRWRISPRSFVSGCGNSKNIEERIARFKRLIDPAPAPHWETLFTQSRERAGLLSRNIVPAAVFYLGDNRALIEELLADPALSSCAFRAEGRLLVVPDQTKKKFLDILTDHGVVY